MNREAKILGLAKLGAWIKNILTRLENDLDSDIQLFNDVLWRSEQENSWFTIESQCFALKQWAELLDEEQLTKWVQQYPSLVGPAKRIGLILAGNIPLVGFHDIISVVLSGHIPVIKLSSKDRLLIPYLMEKWVAYTQGGLEYVFVEKLEQYDAVIATGSNNTARYLEYYFKDIPHIIRKNRTSVAVLSGTETDDDLKALGKDIFTYFGLGCRNVTRLLLPESFKLDRLFENFLDYKEVINHHKYANNYDYNKAIYLLDQEVFWDNNFVMLKESEALFSPLSVINFSRYSSWEEVRDFIEKYQNEIQCVVSGRDCFVDHVPFGQAQSPSLSTYADNIDTMAFLSHL